MGCNGCRDKQSNRHTAASQQRPVIPAGSFTPVKPEDIANQQPYTGNSFREPDPGDPVQEFMAAREMGYEEIQARQSEMRKAADEQTEMALSQMTNDMKRTYVESLVAVANGDLMSLGTLTPEQAVIALKSLLDREDFGSVRDLYPKLKGRVNERYQQIISNNIPLE